MDFLDYCLIWEGSAQLPVVVPSLSRWSRGIEQVEHGPQGEGQ